jgi:intermediate cleaving peptidase 55
MTGYGLRYATSSIFYPFHQNTNLLYLTGFNEPNSCLILSRNQSTLFVQPYDPSTERWDGERAGLTGAREIYGADKAYSISELESFLKHSLSQPIRIYSDLALDSEPELDLLKGTHINQSASSATHVFGAQSRNRRAVVATVYPLASILDEKRVVKSAKEIELMQECANITAISFIKVHIN